MTQSLKIECLVTDLTLEGEVASFLVTKEQLTAGLNKKADLVDGKIKESNLPDFIANGFQTVNQKLSTLETSITDGIQSAKDYAEAYTDEKLIQKADLVDGKVPASQLPSILEYSGLSEALTGVLDQARRDMIERTDEIQRTKADLGEDGKVVREQLPNYDKIPGLETVVTDLYDSKANVDDVETSFKESQDQLDAHSLLLQSLGSILPYNPSNTYEEGYVTLKDGSLQQLVSGNWVPFKINALNLFDLSGETQQQVNYNGGSKWHYRDVGYQENERAVLDNGSIVKSTIDGNTNDPNVDMTGWVNFGNIGEVTTIADLLAIPSPKDGMRVSVKGYHTPTLFVEANPYKGGGTFVWDATSTATANNGTVFAINGVATGRWIRQLESGQYVTPQMFGAKATGKPEDDDYDAIWNAIQSTQFYDTTTRLTLATVLFPIGKYYLSKTLNIRGIVRLLGESLPHAVGNSTTLIFAKQTDGIIINRHNTDGAFGSAAVNGLNADGSSIEGLTITQYGYNNKSANVLDYNPNTKNLICLNNYLAVGDNVHCNDDRIQNITFTGTISAKSTSTLMLVPDKPLVGLSLGVTFTGNTSGASGTLSHIGYSALAYVLENKTGTFVVGETVTTPVGTFTVIKVNTHTLYNYKFSTTTGTLNPLDIVSDVNNYGSAIIARARCAVKDCKLVNFPFYGLSFATDGNQPGNANCMYVSNVTTSTNGRHGIYCQGGDSNAGTFVGINCVGNTGYGIKDHSFLGNHYFSCHTSANQQGSFYSAPYNNFSVFCACYSEGGSQVQPFLPPTSRIGRNSTVIGGDWGAPREPSYLQIKPTVLNGNELSVGNGMYLSGNMTAGNLLDKSFSFRTSSGTEAVSLVNSSNSNVNAGIGIGFYGSLGTADFKLDNTDVVKTGSVSVLWSSDRKRAGVLSIDLLPRQRVISQFNHQASPPSGSRPAIFEAVVTDGVVTGAKMLFSGEGYTTAPTLVGIGDYSGVTISTEIFNGKIVNYTVANGGTITGVPSRTPINVLNIATDSVLPSPDNSIDIGSASNRFKQVFSATGTINTSDEREKQQVRDLSDAEKRVAVKLKSQIKAFKFNDAVSEKGDNARIHFGVIAQEVKAAFESEGLVAEDYAILCYDEWDAEYREITEEITVTNDAGEEVTEKVETGERELIREAGNRYGVRYEELLAFIISAL